MRQQGTSCFLFVFLYEHKNSFVCSNKHNLHANHEYYRISRWIPIVLVFENALSKCILCLSTAAQAQWVRPYTSHAEC